MLLLKMTLTYLDFIRDVESIRISRVREVDADQRIDNVISIIRNAIERIVEILSGILNSCSST